MRNTKILLLVLIFLYGCNPGKPKESGQDKAGDNSVAFGYQLELPDTVWQMPAELREISGLARFNDATIVAVQDEDARIYRIDKLSGKTLSKHDFGKKGDYEGIAVVDNTVWVLKSNGTLYRVENFRQDHPVVSRYKTPLSAANNAEGLAYDPETHVLLIACKGRPWIKNGEKHEGFKAIYSFSLDSFRLDTIAAFLIDLSQIEAFKASTAIRKFYIRAAKKIGAIRDEIFFEPSGIAIHPHSNHLYVVSHTAKLLLVINRRGKIVRIQSLNPIIFKQAEGICFGRNATLYISNEGREGLGNILRFSWRR